MYHYFYYIIINYTELENIHSDAASTFSSKEFNGCRYDKCIYSCAECVHVDKTGRYLNRLELDFAIELSSSEKTELDAIIENYR